MIPITVLAIASMAMAMEGFDFDLSLELDRFERFEASFHSAKVQRKNAELHKTSAYLAAEARGIERAMGRAKGRR